MGVGVVDSSIQKRCWIISKNQNLSNSNGLDRHIAGHYLTALAINHTSMGDLE